MTTHRIDLALKARAAVDQARSILEANEDVRRVFGFAPSLEALSIVLDEYLGARTDEHRRDCLNDIWERTFLLGHDVRRANAEFGIDGSHG